MCDIYVIFFCNDTATTEIYTLSLHDALPISHVCLVDLQETAAVLLARAEGQETALGHPSEHEVVLCVLIERGRMRSEEHTSELQSHSDLVCRLLLEKKTRLPINGITLVIYSE